MALQILAPTPMKQDLPAAACMMAGEYVQLAYIAVRRRVNQSEASHTELKHSWVTDTADISVAPILTMAGADTLASLTLF